MTDPQYFPEPDVFNPERFMPENKGNIPTGTYLSFGIGPRACMGTKITDIESKILLFNILKRFELVPGSKLTNPPKIDVGIVSCLSADQTIMLKPRQL
jgi:cytochrome P450